MKRFFLFILILSAFVSCGESEKDKCKDVNCEEWQECNIDNGVCELINGRCLTNNDCIKNKICNKNHICLPEVNKDSFLITWKTDNIGISLPAQITIPINPDFRYNYKIDCNNDGVFEAENVTTSYTCNYDIAGTYQVAITETFPAIKFGYETDAKKILSIEQWGDIEWKSMNYAFSGCVNFVGQAVDMPDLSDVSDMSYMFENAFSFNQDISSWNVSNVINMEGMFSSALMFNQDISSWDVSNVVNMERMFEYVRLFNQDLSSWNVSNVVNCYLFNDEVSSWILPKPNFTQCNP